MRIGELATATSTQVETIRFYEQEGLLAKPARSEGVIPPLTTALRSRIN